MQSPFSAASGDGLAPFAVEHRIIHASGDLKWVAAPVTTLDGPDGQVELVLAQVLDITDRRRFEEELTRSARYFELSRDMICAAGFDGYFKSLNATWTS